MTKMVTLEELLSYAQTMEREAVERYQELADLMEVHHQREIAELFQTMARIEGKHVDKMVDLAADRELPQLAPWEHQWQEPDSPESIPIGQERYQMTPQQALMLVLACEERARDFYQSVVDSSPDPTIRQMAAEFADEEQQHAQLLRDWLARLRPVAGKVGRADLDEPMAQD